VTDRGRAPQTGGVKPEPAGAAVERPSFRALFLAHASYVANSLRRLGVRERDLEDVTHDVFISVYRHLEDFDPTRPVKPWLFGFAAKTALAYRRRAGYARETLTERIEGIDQGPAADEQIAAQEKRDLVVAALASVHEERRPVLVMHDIDGIAMPDIAAVLAIPLNTGYSRLRLARAEFAQAVQRIRARRRAVHE
jgi:RNA polymerase sigma-70 factor, ECF subfamily